MKEPAIPACEQDRLVALRGYGIIDSSPEATFDELARIAAHICSVPIALVSLVESHRQWFKSHVGIDATETPREISFCGHVVASGELLIVPDATRDSRFFDNPLVTGAPAIRFYAGAPLVTPNGFVLGTLCVADHCPGALTPAQAEMLMLLARQVMRQIELRNQLHELARLKAVRDDILDNTSDLIQRIGPDGRFEYVNRAWRETLGFHDADLAFLSIFDVIAPECRQHAAGLLGLGDAVGRSPDLGVTFLSKGGERVELERTVRQKAPAHDQSGSTLSFLRNVGPELQSRREIGRQKALLEAVFHGLVDPTFLANAQRRIVMVNPATLRVFGYEPHELLGQETSLLYADKAEFERQGVQRYNLDAEASWEPFELTYRRKNGLCFPGEAVGAIIRDASGEFLGYLTHLRDITERKRVEALKSEFVSTVSHELRTPLTSIRGSLGLIIGGAVGEVPEHLRSMLEIAAHNSDRLVRLINDILDIEKLESGKTELRLDSIELLPVIERSIAANCGYAEKFAVGYELRAAIAGVRVHADADRLTQVMDNLLSNAAKFSPPGVPVEILMEISDGVVRVSVRDHGEGIPESFRPRVFERFAQADSSDTRRKGGTGLGLSISRALIEHMGGRLGFETELGVGTTFHFELPQERVEERETTPVAAASGRLVLVCGSQATQTSAVRMTLSRAGFRVEHAQSASAACQQLNAAHFDALIVELGAADREGMSLLQALRADKQHRFLPIVVISAGPGEGGEDACWSSTGVVDWLTEPLDSERLLAALRRATRANPGARPCVLHVEDDEDIVRVVTALAGGEIRIDHAATLADARWRLAREHFDAVILDVGLPDGSGLALFPAIQAAKPPIPVVVFTGQELDPALAVQTQGVLIKSRDSEKALVDALMRVL
ncbi:MAG: PAS domain S-box protein [Candidatus Schekmanbacteria bacterium]|nr:PAS domain S-box protein [Candidatus Schekmanbacteria bacterium]